MCVCVTIGRECVSVLRIVFLLSKIFPLLTSATPYFPSPILPIGFASIISLLCVRSFSLDQKPPNPPYKQKTPTEKEKVR
uniref:Uncharacterized protein n=1 Tax=Anopheles darlingi TaxID=43151 RepID=A0A2M4DIQ2_ANODA